jgi:hypothetical protein
VSVASTTDNKTMIARVTVARRFPRITPEEMTESERERFRVAETELIEEEGMVVGRSGEIEMVAPGQTCRRRPCRLVRSRGDDFGNDRGCDERLRAH